MSITFDIMRTSHFCISFCSIPLLRNIVHAFPLRKFGVVPCDSPKKSPRTSSIVQIIFSFWSFEISESILRNQKIIIGLDSFSNQRLIYLTPFGLL